MSTNVQKYLIERLFENIHVVGECWIWLGADSGHPKGRSKSYGRISVKGQMKATHILTYELFKGEIPDNAVLDHECRNRLCCNPKHLKPKTNKVNTLIGEGPTAVNALKTHCIRGHKLSGNNLILRDRGTHTSRECRECKKARRKKKK